MIAVPVALLDTGGGLALAPFACHEQDGTYYSSPRRPLLACP
jgi:hypothetical protein